MAKPVRNERRCQSAWMTTLRKQLFWPARLMRPLALVRYMLDSSISDQMSLPRERERWRPRETEGGRGREGAPRTRSESECVDGGESERATTEREQTG